MQQYTLTAADLAEAIHEHDRIRYPLSPPWKSLSTEFKDRFEATAQAILDKLRAHEGNERDGTNIRKECREICGWAVARIVELQEAMESIRRRASSDASAEELEDTQRDLRHIYATASDALKE